MSFFSSFLLIFVMLFYVLFILKLVYFRLRREEREKNETENFNSDHYLCDLYETEEINPILRYVKHRGSHSL